MPRVSVILPTYNDLDYLREAIRTGLDQTYSDFELIVVNDGSTDATRDYLDNLQEEKVAVVHKENGGCFDALIALAIVNDLGEKVRWDGPRCR